MEGKSRKGKERWNRRTQKGKRKQQSRLERNWGKGKREEAIKTLKKKLITWTRSQKLEMDMR